MENPELIHRKAYQNREEYFEDLEKWLNEARLWHGVCSHSFLNIQNSNPNNRPYTRLNDNQTTTPTTYEFVIPHLWKRIVAEIVDFFILFIIKIFITFILLEKFNVINMEDYSYENLTGNIQDSNKAIQISIEVLVLEIVHRFTVCCYEIYWLKGGICATPGKKCMGLMVLQAENIIPVIGSTPETVRVEYWAPLGLKNSFIRALVKNFFVGLLLPVFYFFCIFRFNRTIYDVLSNSLVVESNNDLQFQEAR